MTMVSDIGRVTSAVVSATHRPEVAGSANTRGRAGPASHEGSNQRGCHPEEVAWGRGDVVASAAVPFILSMTG